MNYSKPVYVIYNPASGKVRDIRHVIHDCFYSNGIDYQLYETKGRLDALNEVMNFEIDQFSALAIVGGDGTIHEAINGLLRRPDKKKIPIGLIPNGSGDDICAQIGIDVGDSNMALEYITQGDVIKVDVNKILIDHETEDQL